MLHYCKSNFAMVIDDKCNNMNRLKKMQNIETKEVFYILRIQSGNKSYILVKHPYHSFLHLLFIKLLGDKLKNIEFLVLIIYFELTILLLIILFTMTFISLNF